MAAPPARRSARRRLAIRAALAAVAVLFGSPALAAMEPIEPDFFRAAVADGRLPSIAERIPAAPSIVSFADGPAVPGRYGGDLNLLIGRAKDVRLMVVYGYARLIGYDSTFVLRPDILESYEIEDGRVFTLHLRPGHKWSDGEPFTSEDFRYWWQDVANNRELNPSGPPVSLRIDGVLPTVEFPDQFTVRYSWPTRNPYFLPRLAGAAPLFIYRPAHYLKRYHAKYADPTDLAARVEAARTRRWAALHNRRDNMYRFDNPELPTLQPWRNITRPPASRFIGERNPYYHRIDDAGRQLPYIDRLVFSQVSGSLIAAQAASGGADLQVRGLSLSSVPFLKKNEERVGYETLLWRTAKGSHFALYPNLNHVDPAWRALFRDARFRRALSLGIDRRLINQVIYFGLALEGNNSALPVSALYREDVFTRWAEFDTKRANRLLDELGLTKRNRKKVRLLADGRPLEIIVETTAEKSETTDVLELIQATWMEIGIALFVKPVQREVFRNRIFSGQSQMAVWTGFENGAPTAAMSPAELAPTTQQGLQWPKWGQFYETSGRVGEAPDLAAAVRLLELNQRWLMTGDPAERRRVWLEMLEIHAEQQFVIGVIAGVPQPIVASKHLHNLPRKGIYNWNPGAHIGIYRPDTFWLDPPS